MAQGDVHAKGGDGLPVWAGAMLAGHPEAVEELIEAGADLTSRDLAGNGWLHWGIDSGQSPELLMTGLQRLDRTWWHPNLAGDTPLHRAPMDLGLAQALGSRLWSERVSWTHMAQGRDPEVLARALGQPRLGDAWASWRIRCVP